MADFKQCPSCGAHHPPTHAFCPICGASLQDTQVQSLYGAGKEHYWEIPDFLLEASHWQRTRDLGASGSGLLWIGGLLAVVPFLIDPKQPLAIGSFVAGLSIIGLGLLRMRHSPRTLARAGIIANGGAFLALALVVARVIVAPTGSVSNAPTLTPVAAVEESSQTVAANAITIDGVSPMFRGDSAHTGQLGGPAPVGHPVITWRYDSGGEITSTAAVADGLIFFTGKRGDLFSVDAASGELRWQAHLGEYVLGSSPAVVDGSVYVAGGFGLYSFEAETGKERWKLPIQYAAQSSPTVSGGMVYVASQDGRLYGVDTQTGQQQWSYNAEGLIFSSPAASGPLVYIGTDDGQIHAVSAESGNRVWKAKIGGTIFASPAISGNTLIVTGHGGSVVALDTSNGSVIWTNGGVSGASSAAIVGNKVIVGGDDGGIHALSLDSGDSIWLYPTGSKVTSSPVVVGNVVYAASGFNLYSIDLESGSGIWRFSATDTIEASPSIANSQIYIGSLDGFLYAIGGDGK
jgi:outer membrane protein assembly factor BamB